MPPPMYPIPQGAYVGEARFPQAKRPGWATAAAIILLIWGSTSGLFTLPILIGGLVARDVWLLAGTVGAIWTTAHLAAGVGILRRRPWARLLGTVTSGFGALLGTMSIVLILASVPALADWFLQDLAGDRELIEVYGANLSEQIEQTMLWTAISVSVTIGSVVVAYLCALYGLVRSASFFAWRPPLVPSPSPPQLPPTPPAPRGA